MINIFHLYETKSSVGLTLLRFNFIQMKFMYMINNLYLSLSYGANFDLSKIGGKMEMTDVHFFTEPAHPGGSAHHAVNKDSDRSPSHQT